MRLLIHSAIQVVTVCEVPSEGRGRRQVLRVHEDPQGMAVVVDSDGRIAEVASNKEVRERWQDSDFQEVVDATGMCVLPGFVDAHTHPVWSGDRVHEFAMKLSGATYLEIHESGGGIHSTVHSTATTSEDDLYELLRDRLQRMLQAGTTVVECKSGYGLELELELRLLRVLERAKRELPMDVCITFCGAHAVPRGRTAEEAAEDIIERQIPAIARLNAAGELHVENIDVFCEVGVFDAGQSRRILLAGKSMGLVPNFHGDELNPMGAAEMGAEIAAAAVSHLEEVTDDGMTAMAHAGTAAIILPSTAFLLRLRPPPVRQMLDAGVTVALGSDFNPNAYCYAMPLVMSLACVTLRMTLCEALAAATVNAAAALGRKETNGSIEVGKRADFVVIRAPRWEHIVYQLGCHHQLIHMVVKDGRIVYRSGGLARHQK